MTRKSIGCMVPLSSITLMVASLVESITVLPAKKTRSGSDICLQCTSSSAVAFSISSMVVEMKLWVAPESTIAVKLLVPTDTYSSKICNELSLLACTRLFVHVAMVPLLSFLVWVSWVVRAAIVCCQNAAWHQQCRAMCDCHT